MKNYKFLLLMLAWIIFFFLRGVFLVQQYFNEKIDITAVNKIYKAAEKQPHVFLEGEFQYDFTVLLLTGEISYSTKKVSIKSYDAYINDAIRTRETVVFLKEGAVVIYTNAHMQVKMRSMTKELGLMFLGLCLLMAVQHLYWQKRYFRPFYTLKQFAERIAAGQLDFPLPMDKKNVFGAFTESFDLMRNQLQAAKEQAIALEKSKNEMVASLSHDIKTPLSSIMAMSDILLYLETDGEKQKKLCGINSKAEEIDRLVTNLFQTTLEDLSELSVKKESMRADQLLKIIEYADFLGKVDYLNEIPECMVEVDPLRISQIISNVISNAYKYAETRIEVSFSVQQDIVPMLLLSFQDLGVTLEAEEVPLLLNKFYRGRNSEKKQGAGLGLYLCKCLLERMDGELEVVRNQSGFCVRIRLLLS